MTRTRTCLPSPAYPHLFSALIVALVVVFPAAPLAAAGPPNGSPAPDFTLKDAYDVDHSLSDFTGKVVLLDFWSSGCTLCVQELPQVNSLAGSLAERGFVVLGINLYEDKNTVLSFQNQYPDILFLRDTNGAVFNTYMKNGGIPLNYLIDHDVHQTIDYSMEGYNQFLFQSRIMSLLSDVSVNLFPDSSTYHRGGLLGFDVKIENWQKDSRTFYSLVDVRLPQGVYYPLYPPVPQTLAGNASRTVRIDYSLPQVAPLGDYLLRTRIGLPGDLWMTDTFSFEVVP